MPTRNQKPDASGVITDTWALFRKSSSRVEKRNEFLPTIDQTIPPDLDADLAWLEEWNGDQPPFDPATEFLANGETIAVDVGDPRTGTITRTFTAQALSQEVIDDRAGDARLAALEADVLPIARKLEQSITIDTAEEYKLLQYFAANQRL